ncbi:MAG: tripartite tricarboxylate transporter substrate binding protein [Pigmentiphaga sp.]|nr:tripartite tricarboxylate transporter substrate binding protein [Pigmentiphaga sp.]
MNLQRRLAQAILGTAGFIAALVPLASLATEVWTPRHPVNLIVPYPPGGVVDFVARAIAPTVSKDLGVPIIVHNRPGASGVIAARSIANAAPDGYTVGFGSPSTHMVLPAIGMDTQYDPIADFTPLIKLFEYVTVLAVHPDLPVNSVGELIALGKNPATELFYGTPGSATSFHILGELFNQTAEIDMTHVPYKGGNDQTIGLVGGQTQVSFLVLQNVLPFLDDGRIRLLANFADTKHPAIANVPLIRDEFPELSTDLGWMGIFGPPRLPAPIAQRLAKGFQAAIISPEVQDKLRDNGLLAIGHIYQPGEFEQAVNSGQESVKTITSALGIQAN